MPRTTPPPPLPSPPSRRFRVTRDTAILTFSLSAGTYEILWGDARASVLTFLSGLLLAPAAFAYDERRREGTRP